MVRLQHVSFRDWNPIGKPRKKPKEKMKIYQKVLNVELQMLKN